MPSEHHHQQHQDHDADDPDRDEADDYAPWDDDDIDALSDELGSMDVDELQEITNATLDDFRTTHSEAQQQFIADAFIESGVIPTGETFGVSEADAAVVTAGFVRTLERDVFSKYGLNYEMWMEHVQDEDLPEFRKAAIKGDFSVFHRHALEAAQLRKKLGI